MFKNNHSVYKKYLTSAAFATGILLSPMLAGGVSAHGGPDADAGQKNVQTEEQTQVDSSHVKSVNIKKGNRGESVREVQNSLQDRGQTANPDGIFGEETASAVRNFQDINGLSVDGIVGPNTKKALSITPASDNNQAVQTKNVEASGNQENPTASALGTASQSSIVSTAKSLVGTPYVAGGTTPNGFDSSGFINYVFGQNGVSLSRTHSGMWANNGYHVDEPSVGDVVFFEDTYKNGVSHSGIYLGNNQMIHAGTEETGVEVTTMGYDYWQNRYLGAKSFQ